MGVEEPGRLCALRFLEGLEKMGAEGMCGGEGECGTWGDRINFLFLEVMLEEV